MFLLKTDKARAELRPGNRTLGQRERTLLLLADGQKSAQDFRGLFDGEGEEIALRLLREGYLQGGAAAARAPAPAPVAPPTAAQREAFPSPETTQAIRVAADSFEGKRSLATTRMFLFDICERMFARRDPALAEQFREALRAAKDRDSMLAAGRSMLVEIEKAAGHERADSISERIAMLLPPEYAS
ncbi:hypothetical protein [Variovorax terrae]|uniref:Uncharacterized protein n=1 Tax=Variovorax terrae TaxID=2923278 RepID=A0A9X2AR83_9BURK|nr:hypothetical protein [Variovorax terrae]MCJ0763941.1 hypothetical protein [Variovorax terrae]